MDVDSKWRKRISGHGNENPADLTANPRNWRIHPGSQQDEMVKSLDRTGWIRPVMVNQRTGVVIDGHMRVAVALRKGETMIPVDYVDLDDDEEMAVLSTFDPLAAMANMDRGKLKSLSEEARAAGADLSFLHGTSGAPQGRMVDSGGVDADATRESSYEHYKSSETRQMNVLMNQQEYGIVLEAFRHIGQREMLETNRDILRWLLATHAERKEA